jgi:hypothetical protein
MAQRHQFIAQVFIGAHNAVHLRVPGIADNQDFEGISGFGGHFNCLSLQRTLIYQFLVTFTELHHKLYTLS